MNEPTFEQDIKLRHKIWYYLTCWRPITKKEFLSLQRSLVTILEGMRQNDLHHWQTEQYLSSEFAKLKQGHINEIKENKENKDQMFN